ncbi:MAG: type II secretion system protein [Planctomycetes bacterium]|nr:type II secretion system protein [Planctomycetota bacterium]
MIKRKGRSAFTLVELLVVISIITILAALLMPALSKTIQIARDTRCVNNSKQLILGINMYAGGYDDYMPYNASMGKQLTSATGYTGLGLLYGDVIIEDARLFWCANESTTWYHREEGSNNKTYGIKGFLKATPQSGVQNNIFYRCCTRTQNGIVYHNNAANKISKLKRPTDGVLMCAASGWTNRMHWSQLHDGRGCSLAFADGRSVFYDYDRFLPPTPTNDIYDDRYRPDYADISLKRMTCLFYGEPEKIKGF